VSGAPVSAPAPELLEDPPDELPEDPSSPTVASSGVPLELPLEPVPELLPEPEPELPLELPPAAPSAPGPPPGVVPLAPLHAAIDRHISTPRTRMLERTMAEPSLSAQRRQHWTEYHLPLPFCQGDCGEPTYVRASVDSGTNEGKRR